MVARPGETVTAYDAGIKSSQNVGTATDVTFSGITRALYVGVSGALSVVWADGSSQTLTGLAAGVWHPMQVQGLLAAGTTATGIVAGF